MDRGGSGRPFLSFEVAMNRPVIVTPPAIMPVSLVEAKAHLRVDFADDDALIGSLIEAATDHLDGWTGVLGRCLVEQEWRQDFDAFGSCLHLPLGPVISISSVTVGGDTVDPSAYSLKVDAGGRSVVTFGNVLASGATSVVYKAGYATIPEVPEVPAVEPGEGDPPDPPGSPAVPAIPAQSTVPPALKAAILLMVGHWYQSREAATDGAMSVLPMAVDALVAPYRRVGV